MIRLIFSKVKVKVSFTMRSLVLEFHTRCQTSSKICDMEVAKQDYKSTLTCNISPYRKVSGCGQTHRRSSTSARWHDHSHGPCDQLCRRCSRAAPSPFWAPCSPGKCGHSCGSCSTLQQNNHLVRSYFFLHTNKVDMD